MFRQATLEEIMATVDSWWTPAIGKFGVEMTIAPDDNNLYRFGEEVVYMNPFHIEDCLELHEWYLARKQQQAAELST